MAFLTEATAFEDLARYYADPAREYSNKRVAIGRIWEKTLDLINPEKPWPRLDLRILSSKEATYLTVADSSGMMVSLIQSNYRGMGSGLCRMVSASCFRTAESYFLWTHLILMYMSWKASVPYYYSCLLRQNGLPLMSFGLMCSMQPRATCRS